VHGLRVPQLGVHGDVRVARLRASFQVIQVTSMINPTLKRFAVFKTMLYRVGIFSNEPLQPKTSLRLLLHLLRRETTTPG